MQLQQRRLCALLWHRTYSENSRHSPRCAVPRRTAIRERINVYSFYPYGYVLDKRGSKLIGTLRGNRESVLQCYIVKKKKNVEEWREKHSFVSHTETQANGEQYRNKPGRLLNVYCCDSSKLTTNHYAQFADIKKIPRI